MTKTEITELKNGNNGELGKYLNPANDTKTIFFTLDKLGRLPENFDGKYFIPLCNHPIEKIRLLAVKNIGKLCDEKYLNQLENISISDESTMVRREAISSIGRMRNKNAIPILIKSLKDSDPKIVLQAIRGLLVFNDNDLVVAELKKLINHPNEVIKNVIEKEYFDQSEFEYNVDHCKSPDYLKNVVVNGDVLEVLKIVPNESIHLTFTSPPYYNARDYSIYQSYDEYLEFLRDVFKEVHRITKEGRFFILNTSPIIIPRVSRQHSSKRYPIPFDIHPFLVEMGWEFIDDIVWVKPEFSAKDRNSSFRQHRKPLAYKPTAVTEYLMVYRKKTHKLIDWNIRQYDYKTVQESKVFGEIDQINTWKIDPTFDITHTAVFPIELCLRVLKYYSFKNDLVFDPFGGSGTFSKAAQSLDRFFFTTEISDKYFERIKEIVGKNVLFNKDFPNKYYSFQEFYKINEVNK
ncbi:MAG: restriction endonuclease subunit M [Candidatus Marinimicrobia bacterium CG08_land_8_20_14_0_20_45_22]|nr:MAG: restriction endonuclease subunit M [Candidatus Marinimicrobia bacterium CG08_land_8_20_14_0_20_45_22]